LQLGLTVTALLSIEQWSRS